MAAPDPTPAVRPGALLNPDDMPWLRYRPGSDLLTIAALGIKGGLGKSTMVWMWLQALAARGWTVVGIDADPNAQTLMDSYQSAIRRGQTVPFTCISWPTAAGMEAAAQKLINDHGATALVIDTGGEAYAGPDELAVDADPADKEPSRLMEAAGRLCEIGVMPTGPSRPEIRRVPATLMAARKVAATSALAFHVLLVKCSRAAGDGPAARTLLEAKNWPLLRSDVSNSAGYMRCTGQLGDPAEYGYALDEVLTRRAIDAGEADPGMLDRFVTGAPARFRGGA